MDGIQVELFVEKEKAPEITFEDLICPICKGTGYTKGTKCVCSED